MKQSGLTSSLGNRGHMPLVAMLAALLLIAFFFSGFSVQAGENYPATNTAPDRFAQVDFPISFDHPDGWQLEDLHDPGETHIEFSQPAARQVSLYSQTLGRIVISSEVTHSAVEPSEWYQLNEDDYVDRLQPLASYEYHAGEVLILGKSETCQTVPLILAIISHVGEKHNTILTIAQYERGGRTSPLEMQLILETLDFDNHSISLDLPSLSISYPKSSNQKNCAESVAQLSANASKCLGAPMFIPTAGTLGVPWGCQDNSAVCPSYNSNSSDAYLKWPHRGIDIFGGAGTPVYAPYDGTAIHQGQALYIDFDAPYDGKSVYLAHMTDRIASGSRVVGGVTQVGRQGSVGGVVTPHLHITWVDNSNGIETWPTLDPTPFLRAKNLAYYGGWSGGAMECIPAPSCCGCSLNVVATNSLPHLGELIGPPFPNSEPAVTLDITISGDLSSATEHIAVEDTDTTPPNLEAASAEAHWTTDFIESTLTWPAASDYGSGVSGYHVYWGPDANGTADVLVNDPTFQAIPSDTGNSTIAYYLRVAPLDNAGNLGEWQTVHVWQYDGIAPTGSVEVEGGAVVPVLPVTLNLAASDEHSGVTTMRFSSDNQNWSDWEPYATRRGWQLADVDGPQTIYVQFRDAAGNVSESTLVAVSRDFTTALPSSTNYQLARSVMAMGGGAKSSSSYRLLGTSGQPYETSTLLISSNYRLASGYWARGSTALPNNPPDAPSNPSPTHSATDVDVSATLSWTAADPDTDPLTYDVYFGAANPPPLMAAGLIATTYVPSGDLLHDTVYYWRIVAKDNHDNETVGPVWSFTTATVPPGGQLVTLNPTADAFTNSRYPSSNYGVNNPQIKAKDATVDMIAYVKFDGDSLACAAIQSATLRLFSEEASDDGGNLYPIASSWAEESITWDSAPAHAGSPIASAGTVSAGQWVEFDVTTSVSEGKYSFALVSSSIDIAKYSSKEGSNSPELVVEYQEQTGVAPVAAFAFSPSNPMAGQPVQFTDQSTGCPSSWSWTFGDGSTSNERNPVHTFAAGNHNVTLTVSNGSGSDDITYTVSVAEPPAGETIYISPQKAGNMGGVSFAPADIIAINTGTGAWSMHFDASDVGISKNVNAFTVLDDGSILLAFKANQSVSGLGTVTAHDVVRYIPAAGLFEWVIDGSDIGLTTSGERIDALAIDPATGDLLLSTVGTAKVPGPGGNVVSHDEDVLALNVTTPGSNSTAVPSLYMDGTAIAGLKGEDVNGVWIDGDTGDVYIVILGGFNLGGVSGNGRDIVRLTPNGNSYTPVEIYWDGSADGFPVNLDGVSIAK